MSNMKVSMKTGDKVWLACDTETTVYEGQKSTEAWLIGYARLYSNKIAVHHSMGEFIDDILGYRRKVTCWFHNLRFDGTFIVNYLLENGWAWTNEKKLRTKEFKTLITRMNRWYSISIFDGKTEVEFRDSAKLMPMSLEQVGIAFDTEHRKGTMEYEGIRYAGCPVTKEELEYFMCDLLVLKEGLEKMFDSGNTSLTIGSCALKEYKMMFGKNEFKNMFPNLLSIQFGDTNAEAYIRRSYRGGWCYLKKGKEGVHHNGSTFDVNSLYPSMMHSKSGNVYPTGKPHFWKGDIPQKALKEDTVYFIRIRCRFKLREGYLPTVQIKGNPRYRPNEWLDTSDIYYKGKYYSEWIDENGNTETVFAELTMTEPDFKLFREHYHVYDLTILDGCWFYAQTGLFDEYIDKWMEIKMTTTNKAMRTEAKLFLNNLYGKFATGTDSSYQEPVLKSDGVVDFLLHEEEAKEPLYIPVGSLVTSYARCFTIRAAQNNYDNFIYADTDSMHILGNEAKGIQIHDKNLLCWKHESEWSTGRFLRQKVYAEFIRKEDGKKVKAYWNIKCAGMPERSKKLFLATHPITDFDFGLRVGGKLIPHRIPGGVVLKEEYYTLHKR